MEGMVTEYVILDHLEHRHENRTDTDPDMNPGIKRPDAQRKLNSAVRK
jgi:hypothetical protein